MCCDGCIFFISFLLSPTFGPIKFGIQKKGAHLSFSRCATKKTEAPGREQKTGIPKGRAEESKRESESNTLREQPKSAHIKNINKSFFIMCERERATPSCSLIALSLPPLFEKTRCDFFSVEFSPRSRTNGLFLLVLLRVSFRSASAFCCCPAT